MRPIVVQNIDKAKLRGAEDLPDWAHDLIDSHNKNADALRELAGQQGNAIRVVQFATGGTVTDSFPKFVSCPFEPVGVKVVRARNLTDPTAVFLECAVPDWQSQPGGISIRYISGLSSDTNYSITLELLRG